MSLSKELRTLAEPMIDQIYHDAFIQNMLTGDISNDTLKHYLRADAAYLKEFTNLYALLIPKMSSMADVKFLVQQIEFMLEGEVEAHDVLAHIVGEPYEDIIKKTVWPPSGDHYIKHMYYQAYTHENAVYTIAGMAPCPYVYAELAKRAMQDPKLNKESHTVKWFEFYTTEMDELVYIFDTLMDKLTENFTQIEIEQVKRVFLESCVHERKFFAMAETLEQWDFGGQINE